MHPNRTYHDRSDAENLAYAAKRGFGMLCVNGTPGTQGPLISHVPFYVTPDGAALDAHIMRVNPINALLDAPEDVPVAAAMAVSGPDAYVSPDWYGVADQVPTWNYVAVHLRGLLTRLDQTDLPRVLDALSAEMEGRLAPKRPWTADKVNPQILAALQRAIVPVRLRIESIDGTWKLAQNKAAPVREQAADGIAESGAGDPAADLAALMRAAE